jgi:hypothetical protein
MSENDPGALADKREGEAQELERLGDQLHDHVQSVREDWRRKRADPGVPGAVPEDSSDQDAQESPASEAPPQGAEPGASVTPAEGAAGPPADVPEESA